MARTMTVDLGDELREFIESLIESGDYRTQSEVIRESLRLLREKQAESRLQALRDMLAEGLSSGASAVGKGRVLTEGESRDKEIMCVLLNSCQKPMRI